MKYLLIYLIGILLFASCGKEDVPSDGKKNNSGAFIALPILWKIPLNKEGDWKNHNPSLENNMVFGENVIIPTTNNATSRNLTMISSVDGHEIWNWSDWYQPETEGAHFTWDARYNDYLHWIAGTRRYTIDVVSGEMVFRYRNIEDGSFSARITNDAETTYMLRDHQNTEGHVVNSVYKGSIFNENCEEFLNVPYSIDSIGELKRVKSITWAEPYIKNGIDYLAVKSAQPYPVWYYDQRMNLYNLTEEKWVYTDKLAALPKQNNSGWMKAYRDHFYFTAGSEMFCYDILTGDQLWKREFSHDFTFSGFEIAGDIMVANCENQVCYGIDINTGITLWASEGSGTSSNLNNRIMDGVAYFKGGGPSDVFAKDIQTGKTLWRLDAHEYERLDGTWTNNINVIPGKNGEKGKVVVLTKRFAYCFQAAM